MKQNIRNKEEHTSKTKRNRTSLKYFWLYGSILFAIALTLVVFSAQLQRDTINNQLEIITQQDSELAAQQREAAENRSAYQNVAEMNLILNQQVNELQSRLETLEVSVERLDGETALSRMLMAVQNLYNNDEAEGAREMLYAAIETGVSEDLLDEDGLVLLAWLGEQLDVEIVFEADVEEGNTEATDELTEADTSIDYEE